MRTPMHCIPTDLPWDMIHNTWWHKGCRTVIGPWSPAGCLQSRLQLLRGRWSWLRSRAASACPFLWTPLQTNPCQFAPVGRNSLPGQSFPVPNKDKHSNIASSTTAAARTTFQMFSRHAAVLYVQTRTREYWIQRITFAADTNAADTHTTAWYQTSQHLLRSLSSGEGN